MNCYRTAQIGSPSSRLKSREVQKKRRELPLLQFNVRHFRQSDGEYGRLIALTGPATADRL